MDELDFYTTLLENGITEEDVRTHMGVNQAKAMNKFCSEHGLYSEKEELDKKFENYLCERGDEIENEMFNFIKLFSLSNTEWDINMIRTCIDEVQTVLENKRIYVCNPYFDENEEPCYKGNDCKRPNCLYKKALVRE